MHDPSNQDSLASIVYRDPAVSILFGIALFLMLFIPFAGAVFARTGHPELLEAALVLTGAFAVVGAVFGLVRGLRSRTARTRRSV